MMRLKPKGKSACLCTLSCKSNNRSSSAAEISLLLSCCRFYCPHKLCVCLCSVGPDDFLVIHTRDDCAALHGTTPYTHSSLGTPINMPWLGGAQTGRGASVVSFRTEFRWRWWCLLGFVTLTVFSRPFRWITAQWWHCRMMRRRSRSTFKCKNHHWPRWKTSAVIESISEPQAYSQHFRTILFLSDRYYCVAS